MPQKQQTICDLTFPTTVLAVRLNRKRLVVILEDLIYLYEISNMKLLHTIETSPNPQGIQLPPLHSFAGISTNFPQQSVPSLPPPRTTTSHTLSRRKHFPPPSPLPHMRLQAVTTYPQQQATCSCSTLPNSKQSTSLWRTALPSPASASTILVPCLLQPLIKAPSCASSLFPKPTNSTNSAVVVCPLTSTACPSTPPPPCYASLRQQRQSIYLSSAGPHPTDDHLMTTHRLHILLKVYALAETAPSVLPSLTPSPTSPPSTAALRPPTPSPRRPCANTMAH